MTSLAQYDAARAALAAATRVDEILPIREQMEHLKLHAKHVQNKELMADAADIQIRAERKLGFLLIEAEKAGQIRQGRPKKADPENPTNSEGFTLKEIGVSHRLSADSQQKASISEQALEAMIAGVRQRIMNGRAKIIDAPAAHMGGRAHQANDLDYSPTPPWATRALIERVLRHAGREGHCKFQKVWEPACGEGHMAEVLREYFRFVAATDIHEGYGYADHIGDFLGDEHKVPAGHFDWIITNPPFEDRVIKFMKKALALAGTGVAMFLQLRYLEGIARYEQVFKDTPPTIVAPFVERVPLLMGQFDPNAKTTTAFMWLVWLKGAEPRAPFWIPPGSAKALTKPDDKVRFTQKPVQKRAPVKVEAAE